MGIWILDSEWSQLKEPHDLHVIVCRNVDNPAEFVVFDGNKKSEFPKWSKENLDVLVGHNILGFDLDSLNNYFPELRFPPTRVIDTLVCSRLFNFRTQGGHSVENYASRFVGRQLPTENRHGLRYPSGLEKVQINDWQTYTSEIRERCITDTLIQYFIYNYLSRWIRLDTFKQALRTEHYLAHHCKQLEDNGFGFDKAEAEKLKGELNDRLTILDKALVDAFPPVRIHVSDITVRGTKHNTIYAVDFRRLIAAGYDPRDLVVGQTYPIYEIQAFNPGSLKQIIDRLWDAGWKPTEKTKGHSEFLSTRSGQDRRHNHPGKEDDRDRRERFARYGWRLSDENLRSLPDSAPKAARSLVERLLIASRISDLDEWLGLVTPKGLIHGKFFHIGSWTQRMATSDPNMQNIPVPQHKNNRSELDKLSDSINERMRQLWIPEVKGNVLVGTDADGIQMRVFAHYVNDPRLTFALDKGRKEDGTDIHTVHWKALGDSCKGRNPAKTFIYAWLLGAGIGKVAEILECSYGEAREAVERFISFYPGLQELKSVRIPRDAGLGYFKGLDNRLVLCDNTHLMLAGYLQNGEKVIMSRALQIWQPKLVKEGIYFIPRNFVHDEWQTETRPDLADYVGSVQAEAIKQAGEELNMNCPLAGQYKVGFNWLQTH